MGNRFKHMNLKRLFLVFSGVILSVSLFAQKENSKIRNGNDSFVEGDFEAAEKSYRDALAIDPDDFKSSFNLADALYKQGKIDDALKEFSNLAGTVTDKEKLSSVYHNMGNCYMKNDDYQNAVDAYKNSLRNNPSSENTRYNLAYAKQKLMQQQNQQNQENQQNQDNKEDNKDKENKDDKNKDNKDENKKDDQKDKNEDSDNQDKKDDEGEKGDKDKDKENKDNQDKNDQNQGDDQNKEQKDQNDNKDGSDSDKNKDNKDPANGNNPPKQQENTISREDAERLLEALQRDENKTQQKVKKAQVQKAKGYIIENDW